MTHQFRQVDVFTDTPYLGNPVAVVLDADGLSGEQMQLFARWTNLSETTFVLAPRASGADYLVRIFTPTRELPFAGHPTLGTCHAWLEAGGRPADPGAIMQECGAVVGPGDVDDVGPRDVQRPRHSLGHRLVHRTAAHQRGRRERQARIGPPDRDPPGPAFLHDGARVGRAAEPSTVAPGPGSRGTVTEISMFRLPRTVTRGRFPMPAR